MLVFLLIVNINKRYVRLPAGSRVYITWAVKTSTKTLFLSDHIRFFDDLVSKSVGKLHEITSMLTTIHVCNTLITRRKLFEKVCRLVLA